MSSGATKASGEMQTCIGNITRSILSTPRSKHEAVRAPHILSNSRSDSTSNAMVHHCNLLYISYTTMLIAALIQEHVSKRYTVLWYKNASKVGIRRKFAEKKQIFSFGGRRSGLTEEKGRSFGDDALQKLDAGMTENEVEEWSKAVVQS